MAHGSRALPCALSLGSAGALAAQAVLERVREREVQPVELQHVRVRG